MQETKCKNCIAQSTMTSTILQFQNGGKVLGGDQEDKNLIHIKKFLSIGCRGE